MAYRAGKNEFARLVELALAELPEEFVRFLDEVPIEIRDRPSPKQLHDLGLHGNELLLGLYTGVSIADRSVLDGVRMPAVIYLFQDQIERVCSSADKLKREIRKTVLHEIGHHFGLDEMDLDRLGYG